MTKRPRRRFDTTIYRKGAVREALRAFRTCAELKAVPVRGGIEVEVRRGPAEDRDRVLDAFANFVLGATWKAR